MIARVDVLLSPSEIAPARLRDAAVVVIDVLRATTVIATALANGAAGVMPVATAEEAAEAGRRLGRDRVLLGGERHAMRIAGFDLDNAPASYAPEIVGGKTVVLTTTNGTAALTRSAGAAARVRTAALVDRRAVATALDNDGIDHVVVVCAGNDGGASFEDITGAGALVDALLTRHPTAALGDGARAAAVVYHAVAQRLSDAIASGDHAQRLAALGFGADLVDCARIDTLDVAPVLRDGVLGTRL